MDRYPHLYGAWGIGRRYAAMLHAYGVHTALDFARRDANWVRRQMSIMGLRTFGESTPDFIPLSEAISNFASKCAYKLRKQESCAKELQVFITTNPYRQDLPQHFDSRIMELPVATSSSIELIKYAKQLLKQMYRPGFRYKKAGVVVQHIVPKDQVQGNLFDTVDRPKHNKLMSVIDDCNDSIDREKILFLAQAFTRQWHLKQEHMSRCFSTQLKDVIEGRG